MSDHPIHGYNELRVQNSLLSPGHPIEMTNLSHSSAESHSSEQKILPGSNVPKGDLRSKPQRDYWMWEFIGAVGSAVALIGIVIILRVFDGKRQPSWDGVSLNSVISWISTVAKMFILMPITSGLGQLKWVWFAGRKRPLSDLQIFDSASRGISGSAKLLWRLQGSHFAVIGALAVILALGFDPFIQNLVHYYPNAISDSTQPSYLANTSIYSATGPLMAADYFNVDPVLKANVYNSVFNPNSTELWSKPQYICNTGNCTWPAVANMAIQPLCSDISTHMSMSCALVPNVTYSNCTISLSNGFAAWFIDGGANGIPMIIQNVRSTDALVYTNQSLPVIQSIIALYNDTNPDSNILLTNQTKFIATECALAPCVRGSQVTVKQAVYSESTPKYWFNQANSTDNTVNTNDTSPWFRMSAPPWGPELGITEDQTFGITREALNALNTYISYLFSGTVRIFSDTPLAFETRTNGYGSSSDMLQSIFYGNFSKCDNPSDKVGCSVKNIGAAMSKSIWDSQYLANGISGADMTIGETFVILTFVRITWWWFALPVVIWILSVVTLLGTLLKTHRAQLQMWRNNLLPLAFAQLYGAHESADGCEISDEGFEKRAENLYVILDEAGGDVRLVNSSGI